MNEGPSVSLKAMSNLQMGGMQLQVMYSNANRLTFQSMSPAIDRGRRSDGSHFSMEAEKDNDQLLNWTTLFAATA